MDNGLIFPYHRVSVQDEPGVLRKALGGLPPPPVVVQQWGDEEGYANPGVG